jgi:hypothetical protein
MRKSSSIIMAYDEGGEGEDYVSDSQADEEQ